VTGEARRRPGRHLYQGRAAAIADRDEVSEAVLRHRQHPRRCAARERGPVSLGGALDDRRIAGEEQGLPLERVLVVADERDHRVHRPRDRTFTGASELTLRADESEPGQDTQRDGQHQDRDREVASETPHEPILGPQGA